MEFKTKREGFARAYISCESNDRGLKTAHGLVGGAGTMPLTINLETGFPMAAFSEAYGFDYGSGVMHIDARIEKLKQEEPENIAEFDYIKEHDPSSYYYSTCIERATPLERTLHTEEHAMWGGMWIGHAVPNMMDFAYLGTDAMRTKVEKYRALNPGKDTFYDTENLALDAIEILGRRFGELAQEMLKTETDPDHVAKLQRIAKTFDHAPKQPCRDFAEALIVYTMVFTFDGVDSPGRFDQYMLDFWRRTDEDLRMEYLNHLWVFFHDTRTWNLCISGSDENWNDQTNELTYAILDMVSKYRFQTPNLTMRCHRNTPEKLLRAAAKAIGSGTGLPVLYNDEIVCPALESLGIPPCDSHLYCMNGCNQIDIQGKSHMGLNDGEVCIAKAMEYTMHNGHSGMTGKLVAPETGDPCDFKDYDEFYAAFIRQLDYLTDGATAKCNCDQQIAAEIVPYPTRSLIIEGCLEKGLDYKAGGPLYGHGQILAQGIADTADSLAAIKKFVYEDRTVTMAEMVDALNRNFEGREDLRYMLKTSDLKFGNDNDYVDMIAKGVVDHFNSRLRATPTWRGGFFGGGCSPFNSAAQYGSTLAALPNGRKNGDVIIADSIGSVPGSDTNGPTALLKSCLKFDHKLPTSGFILNLKFDKELFNTEKGMDGFLSLLHAYFDNGGQQISAYVVSADELLDAQAHPENHGDLIVRVGGYSDYFVALPKDLQDNVVHRTCNAI